MVNKAFVEKLCEHCGVVRVGASGPFPSPYLYSLTYRILGEWVEPIGFDHPKISRNDADTIVRVINDATGKLVMYRRTDGTFYQVDPKTIGNRILVRREQEDHP